MAAPRWLKLKTKHFVLEPFIEISSKTPGSGYRERLGNSFQPRFPLTVDWDSDCIHTCCPSTVSDTILAGHLCVRSTHTHKYSGTGPFPDTRSRPCTRPYIGTWVFWVPCVWMQHYFVLRPRHQVWTQTKPSCIKHSPCAWSRDYGAANGITADKTKGIKDQDQ